MTASVMCLTYNHVNYIRDTIEGIINQSFDGDLKVLIVDDASTDGTSDIVREYAEKYSDLIHAEVFKENTYNHPKRNTIMLDLEKRYGHNGYI